MLARNTNYSNDSIFFITRQNNETNLIKKNVSRIRNGIIFVMAGIMLVVTLPVRADNPDFDQLERIKQLEQMVERLSREVDLLKKEKGKRDQADENSFSRDYLDELRRDIDELKSSQKFDPDSWLNRFTLGGYGEMHANFGEGDEKDIFDIHRLVLYLGYDFSDWIKFHSETEIEHAYVSDDSGGELSLEQAYVDFLLSEPLNLRAGRILTPLGIINKKHEPTTFNGVERPSFAKYIIPTTWSSDGIGLFGSMSSSLQYEAYVVGGLDGSEFNATNGIRGGRIKERPSLHEPAFTGRIDYYPLADLGDNYNQELRLGFSGYFGGLDNGNQGENPDINADIHIYSADFEYSASRFDFRGAIADLRIDGTREIGKSTAKEIFGFYVEGAYHFWPDSWKIGKLESTDAVVFVRYDDFDTQYKMPSGISDNPAGDRNEWTIGVNFFPTNNFVIKMDYQFRDNGNGEDLPDLMNLGAGWHY